MRSATSRRLTVERCSISSLLLVTLRRRSHFLHVNGLLDPKKRGPEPSLRRRMVAWGRGRRQTCELQFSRSMQGNLRSMRIGPVEIPTRVVSRPWRGVRSRPSAARSPVRAGMVLLRDGQLCRPRHRNERDPRVFADRIPTSIPRRPDFGSKPSTMAEAPELSEAAGADLIDITSAAGQDRSRRPAPARSAWRSGSRRAIVAPSPGRCPCRSP